MPENIRLFIQSKVPTFFFKYSKIIEGKYISNTCPRRKVIYGDFFLHDEPESPFFSADGKDANRLYIKEIPLDDIIEIEGRSGSGTGEMILEHAIKL